MKVTYDKPTVKTPLMSLIDMLVFKDESQDLKLIQLKMAIQKLDKELAFQRRLQGVFNVLFGLTVGVLVVMVWRFA